MVKEKEMLFWELVRSARDLVSENEIQKYLIESVYNYLIDKHEIQDDYRNMEVYNYIVENSDKNICLDRINDIIRNYSDNIDELIIKILNHKFEHSMFYEDTNEHLIKLVIELLRIEENDNVFDLGCGIGNVLANVYQSAREKHISINSLNGLEINTRLAELAQLSLKLLTRNKKIINLNVGNAFNDYSFTFNKGYCFPPFGLKQLMNDNTLKSKLFDYEFNARNTAEWLFVDSLLSKLEDGGRAVAFVSLKALYNKADMKYRNKLIESKMIETIIELPAGSLSYTNVKGCLIVFSKDNDTVKFIDGNKFVNGGIIKLSKNEFPLNDIINEYNSEEVVYRNINELVNNLNLTPENILLDVYVPKNGIQLSELAQVFNGSQYTNNYFKDMLSEEKTDYRYLTSSDIVDGLVNWNNLPYINFTDTKFDKYTVQYGDIIITSKSSKVKIAVVDIEPKEKIIVTGAMIIVRPDTDKLNPTFLKVFLESEQGVKLLKSIQKGEYIISINSKDLASLIIPAVDIEKQNMIANKYNLKLSSLIAYKKQIIKLEDDLRNFYLDEMGSDL